MAYQASYLLDAPFSIVTVGYAYFSMIAGFAIGPSLRELHSLPSSAAVRIMLPWALAVGGAMLVLGLCSRDGTRCAQSHHAPRCAHHRTDRDRRSACSHRGRWLSRTVLRLGRDSDIVLISIGLASAKFRIARLVAAAALLAVCAISTGNRVRLARYWNEDARALGDYLRSASAPSVPVFVTAKYMAVPVRHYLGAEWTVCALPNAAEDGTGAEGAPRVVKTVTPRDSAFWLVYSRPFHSNPEGRLPRDLTKPGLLRSRRELAGIILYHGV